MQLVIRKKLNFWGAVASIIGVPLAIFFWALPPTTASSQSQPPSSVSTTGYQSPAIGSSGRDVIINYNATVKETGYELKRSTPLMDTSDLAVLLGKDISKHIVCDAIAGTSVTPTGQTAQRMREVEVTDVLAGECTGKKGWVSIESLGVK